MPIVTPFSNPLRVFVSPTNTPAMSVDGLVVNDVYAVTGVLDSIPSTTPTIYNNPQIAKVQGPTPVRLPQNHTAQTNSPYFTSFDFGGSATNNYIYFSFDVNTFINQIQVSLLNVPCAYTFSYQNNSVSGSPTILLTDPNGVPVSGIINGNSRLLNQIANINTNSQDILADPADWVTLTLDLTLVQTTQLTLVLNRVVPLSIMPQSEQTMFQTTQYPLGVRGFSAQIDIESQENIPPFGEPIVTQNSLGFTEIWNAISQSESGIQIDPNTSADNYWRSDPQPVKDAVVYMIADIRDENLNPQLFDQMYLEPLYSGLFMNLYYSQDDTISPVWWTSLWEGSPVADSASYAGYQVPGAPISLFSGQPWTIGLTYAPSPQVVSGLLTTIGLWQLNFANAVSLSLQANYSSSLELYVFELVDNNGIVYCTFTPPLIAGTTSQFSEVTSLVLGWEGNTWTLFVNGTPYTSTGSAPSSSFVLSSFQWGGNGLVPSSGDIEFLWLKQDSPQQGVAQAFTSNPEQFIHSKGPETVIRGDYRALVLYNGDDNYTRLGPNTDYYSSKQWTALPQDLNLQNGLYTLPPIHAKYIKLEFTNLSCQPYPLKKESVTRTVNIFPGSVTSYFGNLSQNIQDIQKSTYSALNMAGISGTKIYSILPISSMYGIATGSRSGIGPQWPSMAQLNNTLNSPSFAYPGSTVIITEPSDSFYNLDITYGGANYQDSPLDRSWYRYRFPTTGIHQYTEATIAQTWNQSYFAGLKTLLLYKKAYTGPTKQASLSSPVIDDCELYFETCLSPNGTIINPNNSTMQLQSGTGYVAASANETIETVPLTSLSTVESVQLAGITSDWFSIASDADILLQNPLAYSEISSDIVPLSVASGGASIISGVSVGSSIPTRNLSYWPLTDTPGSALLLDQWNGNNLIPTTPGSGTITLGVPSPFTAESETCVGLSNGGYLVSSGLVLDTTLPVPTTPLEGSMVFSFQTGPSTTSEFICGLAQTTSGSSFSPQYAYIDGSGYLHFAGNGSAPYDVSSSSTAFNDSLPHRVVVTWALVGTLQQLSIYVDGNLLLSEFANVGQWNESYGLYFVVGNGIAGLESYNGNIGEIAYLNVPMTAEQVQDDYGTNGPDTSFGIYGIGTTVTYPQSQNLLQIDDALFQSSIGSWIEESNCGVTFDTIGNNSYLLINPIPGLSPTASMSAEENHIYPVSAPAPNWEPDIASFPIATTAIGSSMGSGGSGSGVPVSVMISLLGLNNPGTATMTVACFGTNNVYLGEVVGQVTTSFGAAPNTGIITQSDFTQVLFQTTTLPGTIGVKLRVVIDDAGTVGPVIATMVGLFLGNVSTWSYPPNFINMRASAVARVFLPDTAKGTYQIRLKSGETIAASRNYTLPLRTWTDLEVVYVTSALNYQNLTAEVVQISPDVDEQFYIQMLGQFLHPIRWETSIDGTNWKSVSSIINNPWGYEDLLAPSTSFYVRLTGLISGSAVQSILIRPVYTSSPFQMQTSFDAFPDPKSGASVTRQAPQDMGMFKLWDHFYPIRFSTEFMALNAPGSGGASPTTGLPPGTPSGPGSSPTIVLSPTSGAPYSTFSVQATNFAPLETVSAVIGSNNSFVETTNASGSCILSLSVPSILPAGTYTVTATGAIGDSATAPFQILPIITVNPTSGIAGSSFTVRVEGFGATETVTFYLSGSIVGSCVTASTGAGSASINVPNIVPGIYQVTGRGAITGISISTPFTITTVQLSGSGSVTGIGDLAGRGVSGVPSLPTTWYDTTPTNTQYVAGVATALGLPAPPTAGFFCSSGWSAADIAADLPTNTPYLRIATAASQTTWQILDFEASFVWSYSACAQWIEARLALGSYAVMRPTIYLWHGNWVTGGPDGNGLKAGLAAYGLTQGVDFDVWFADQTGIASTYAAPAVAMQWYGVDQSPGNGVPTGAYVDVSTVYDNTWLTAMSAFVQYS